ncbi:hypothetical protein FDECE_15478 [Fusarium decemcellulare]|nr:hypothetical protein FDECE_15478 [Fusarium decemcellulare]
MPTSPHPRAAPVATWASCRTTIKPRPPSCCFRHVIASSFFPSNFSLLGHPPSPPFILRFCFETVTLHQQPLTNSLFPCPGSFVWHPGRVAHLHTAYAQHQHTDGRSPAWCCNPGQLYGYFGDKQQQQKKKKKPALWRHRENRLTPPASAAPGFSSPDNKHPITFSQTHGLHT